jgi:hypothetical protein
MWPFRSKPKVKTTNRVKINQFGGRGNRVIVHQHTHVTYNDNHAPLFVLKFKTRNGTSQLPVRARSYGDVEEQLPTLKAEAQRRGLPLSRDVEIEQAAPSARAENEVNITREGGNE